MTISQTSSRPWRLAPWCFVLVHAACGLAVAWLWFPVGDLAVESDFFAELGPAAQAIARGEISVHNHPYKGPGHGFALAGLQALLGPLGLGWYRTAVVLSLLSTAGALLLVHRLAKACGGERVGLAAMVLTGAVYEVFVQAHKASSDPLFLLLGLATVATVLTAGRTGEHRWLPAGVLAAAAFLTRYIGAVLVVWVFWQALAGRASWTGRARRAGLALAGCALLAGPWSALSLHETGSLLASRNLETIERTFAPVVGPGTAAAATSVGDLIARDPGRVLGHYLLQVATLPWRDAVHLLGLPLALLAWLGLAGLRWRAHNPLPWRWLLSGALYVLALGWVFYLPRFSVPLAPLYAMLAAMALLAVPGARAPAWDRRLAGLWAWRGHLPAWLLVAALLAFQAGQSVQAVRYYRSEQPLHLTGAIAHLETMAANRSGDAPPVLLARTAHAAFHSGCAHRPYPRRALGAAAFLAQARAQGAELVLVGPTELRLAPGLAFLPDLAGYGGLTVVFDDGVNTVLELNPAADQFGRDLVAAKLTMTVADALAAQDLAAALDPGHELMMRHVRARRFEAARAVVSDLLAHLRAQPDPDRDLVQGLARDLAWIESQLQPLEGPRP